MPRKKTLRNEFGRVVGEKRAEGIASSGELSPQGAVIETETSSRLDALIVPQPVSVGAKTTRDVKRTDRPQTSLRYTIGDGERWVNVNDLFAALKEAGYSDLVAALRGPLAGPR